MKYYHATHLRYMLILAVLFAASVFAGQQKLTNQDVIKMVKAGLSSEIVIQTIKTSEQNFDLSANGLVILKGEGVPDQVIQALLVRTENIGSKPSQPSLNDLNDTNHTKGAPEFEVALPADADSGDIVAIVKSDVKSGKASNARVQRACERH